MQHNLPLPVFKLVETSESDPPEYLVIDLMRAGTTIRTPARRRTLYCGWCEFIRSRALEQCWDAISQWTKLRVAWTLPQYTKRLRHSQRASRPSQTLRLNASTKPRVGIRSRTCAFCQYYYVPEILRFWCFINNHASPSKKSCDLSVLSSFKDPVDLVFIQNYLNMRKVILDSAGEVALETTASRDFLLIPSILGPCLK